MDIICPRCGGVMDSSKDGAVERHECWKCSYVEFVPITSGYIRPEGWLDDLRFNSNYNAARKP